MTSRVTRIASIECPMPRIRFQALDDGKCDNRQLAERGGRKRYFL
jgi:hypothetical protein